LLTCLTVSAESVCQRTSIIARSRSPSLFTKIRVPSLRFP
jgi:hypothetical protein